MSLSGNLGFVSLDEVLRLITRSKQVGAVDVKGDRVNGRIYMTRSGVSLATTYSNDMLRQHLTRSGLLAADEVREIAAGTLTVAATANADKVIDLLREMSVEGIHQLGLHGTAFEVAQDETTPFGNPDGFDLEDLLSDARRRMAEWEEVRAIVSDLDREVRLQQDLGDRTHVTLDRDAWRLVSRMGHGASIRQLSDQIGTTEFWTARVAAGMVEEDLMTMDSAVEAEPEPVYEEPAYEEPTAETEEFPTTVMPEAVPADDMPAAETAAEELADDDMAAEEEVHAGFAEPEYEPATEEDTVFASADETEDEVDPNESWWKEPDRGHSDEVEEDTEMFLEKVFSEVEPGRTEAEEGYGLLRRRRLGAIRDNAGN